MNALNFSSIKSILHNSDFYYIICTDNEGNYSYINNRYAHNFSHISGDFVGQPYHITMHPDDTRICEEAGGLCYAHPGKLFPATIRKYNGNGGYVVTQWEFTLMVEDGQTTGVFCLGYDITEYISVKDKIQTIHKDLETKNELLEAIAYEQSHLVRAPLANIIGLVSILKNMDMGPNAQSIINMLEESSIQLDNAIKKTAESIKR